MKAFTSFAAALVTAAAVAGCTVHQSDQPPVSGPSTFALSLSVTTSPQTITQNGADAAVVTAKVFFTDPKTGQTSPKANLPIRFDMQVNGQLQDYGTLSSRTAVTDANGVARATYTAPPMPVGGNSGNGCNGVPGQCVDIIATTTDSSAATSSGVTASGFAIIALVPPGVILPPAFTPKAAFTFLPSSGMLVGQAVTFDASTSCATDATGNCSSSGTIVSYTWNFGDGQSGSGRTVTHSFTSSGSFVITLTVTSDRGLSASTSQSLSVGLPAAPTADFTFSPAQPIAGQTVFFSADVTKATPGHPITQYTWTYGDGSTDSGVAVSHAFTQPGTYAVILSVVDDVGQKSSKSQAVPVSSANPTAKLNIAKSGGNAVVADGSLSTAVLGSSINTYAFNFGDGTTPVSGTAAIVSHTFGANGTYTVTLTVTDSSGRTGSVSAAITVP